MASIRFYFDEMLSRPAEKALIQRGVEVVMAIDVEMTGKTDTETSLVHLSKLCL
jgi:hypothetical protein